MFVSEKKSAPVKWLLYPFLLVLSAAVLLFAVENSPLYPINDWVDPNCFLTVGKAILAGKVPYRDIYEQKGPYVYFLHALCALIDGDSFFGVWLAEIAACFLFLLSVCKILSLYHISDFRRVAVIASLLCLSVYFSFAMSTGDSVEEFSLPVFSWIVFLTLRRIRRGGSFRPGEFLFIGAAAGILFWSKFTLVGFFIGWYLFFLYRTVRKKRYGEIGASVLWIVCGVLAATLPPLFYFAAHGAVGDWLGAYVYDNLFLYQERGNLFVRLGKAILNFLSTLGTNFQYNFFVLLGIFCFARKRKEGDVRAEEGMLLLILPAVTALFLYIGGRAYRYYGLPLAAFSVFGYISAAEWIGRRVRERGALFSSRKGKIAAGTGAGALVLALCLLFMGINGNFWYIFKPEEETVQYRFAERIKEKEGAVLLNYGFLDGGFYLAAGQVPEFRYFCLLNIPKEEMTEEMDRYLQEGRADFVVLKIWKHHPEELQSENYREIMREKARYRGDVVTYVLYEKAEDAEIIK